MVAHVLDCFQLKPEFLPANFASYSLYVRPNELPFYADASQWEYVGRTFRPSAVQAAEVERYGYCSRPLPSGFAWKQIRKTWYGD